MNSAHTPPCSPRGVLFSWCWQGTQGLPLTELPSSPPRTRCSELAGSLKMTLILEPRWISHSSADGRVQEVKTGKSNSMKCECATLVVKLFLRKYINVTWNNGVNKKMNKSVSTHSWPGSSLEFLCRAFLTLNKPMCRLNVRGTSNTCTQKSNLKNIARCRPERDEKQRCFSLRTGQGHGEKQRGCKQPSVHMHTDRFQMIVSKRGYAPGVCEALEIPCGTIHTHITYQTDESPWKKKEKKVTIVIKKQYI